MEPQPSDRLPRSSFELPELLAAPKTRPRWQFGLWYLLLLTTAIAAMVGVARNLSTSPLAIGMSIYAMLIVIYLLVRIPWVIALMQPERDRIRENRRRLAEWADQKLKEERKP
jgi:hypothetical protein